ncbi:MAG: hypothetical protein CVT98_02210 [Bacteroidetes bacterium HGW-Bacteroidetes-15]|nr:MAG: hypothetical protein CVT98_02210 [Bacteroidetes bacterium HGW-Bacteroidetes-15]
MFHKDKIWFSLILFRSIPSHIINFYFGFLFSRSSIKLATNSQRSAEPRFPITIGISGKPPSVYYKQAAPANIACKGKKNNAKQARVYYNIFV